MKASAYDKNKMKYKNIINEVFNNIIYQNMILYYIL